MLSSTQQLSSGLYAFNSHPDQNAVSLKYKSYNGSIGSQKQSARDFDASTHQTVNRLLETFLPSAWGTIWMWAFGVSGGYHLKKIQENQSFSCERTYNFLSSWATKGATYRHRRTLSSLPCSVSPPPARWKQVGWGWRWTPSATKGMYSCGQKSRLPLTSPISILDIENRDTSTAQGERGQGATRNAMDRFNGWTRKNDLWPDH